MKYLFIGLAFIMVGCTPYSDEVAHRNDVTNLVHKGDGYIQYDIEQGTVRCREHTRRPELTCWKK